ncbi:MAG: aminoglycoside phosphotransferase family protein [Proteobacteria bacterium]|nr:aminoglycoside phosphotransferase family protein [Pseudomonadota bacterium]
MTIVSADTTMDVEALGGGVSSDIVKVTLPGRTLCVKRALPKLRVAADWHAPVVRNRYELAWLRAAAGIVPGHVPAVLGEDAEAGAFAMEWLDPGDHPVWKALLRDGHVDVDTAAAVGDVLGRIHAATADRPAVAAAFATDAIFAAIRLEPYLLATGARHPDLAATLERLATVTARTKRVLVHGDYSPKNILIGPAGPVVLDAECAWYGDPAFDLAFVLNHLLLKGVWRPAARGRYLDAYAALVDAYRQHVAWEPWPALDARTAALLPGLLLGRVDGRSPAEYLITAADRDHVRHFARTHLASAVPNVATLAARWARAA